MAFILKLFIWMPLGLVVYSYVLYPLILALCARLFRSRPACDPAFQPSIAFLVPAYNEEQVIAQKIANILSIDYPADKISVWVGSDCSSDATHDIVRACAADDSRVHLWIAPDRGGKTQVVNRLLPTLAAELVLLTDANTKHRPDCLLHMAGYFADQTVGVVAGLIVHEKTAIREVSEDVYRSFEVWQKQLESDLHSSISAFGGFYLLRRSLYLPIPLNAYSNDDVLIPMNVIRQGRRVIFARDAVSEEDLPGELATEFKRRIRIGAGNYQSFSWLLDFLNPLRGWPAFCYVSHKAIRWLSALLIAIAGTSLIIYSSLFPDIAYRALLAGSMISLALVVALYALTKNRLLRPPFYFLAMNAALLLGFFRFMSGIRSAAWSRTVRS